MPPDTAECFIVIDLDLPALRATPVEPDPFPHLVVPNFVPPAALAEVVRERVRLDRGGAEGWEV